MLDIGTIDGHPATHYVGGLVFWRGDRLYSSRKDNGTGVWHVEQWRTTGDTLVR